MSDETLTERLRAYRQTANLPQDQADMHEAADEIDRLRAENERLTLNYETAQRSASRYHEAWKVLVDLDRNEHGRHRGDVDTMDPSGTSQGNPFALDPGHRIGTTLLGEPITWETLEEIVRPRRALEGDER